jgi:hypothetical protein
VRANRLESRENIGELRKQGYGQWMRDEAAARVDHLYPADRGDERDDEGTARPRALF